MVATATLELQVRHPDFWEMLLHHIVTWTPQRGAVMTVMTDILQSASTQVATNPIQGCPRSRFERSGFWGCLASGVMFLNALHVLPHGVATQ